VLHCAPRDGTAVGVDERSRRPHPDRLDTGEIGARIPETMCPMHPGPTPRTFNCCRPRWRQTARHLIWSAVGQDDESKPPEAAKISSKSFLRRRSRQFKTRRVWGSPRQNDMLEPSCVDWRQIHTTFRSDRVGIRRIPILVRHPPGSVVARRRRSIPMEV
jgi:hypothetical protein